METINNLSMKKYDELDNLDKNMYVLLRISREVEQDEYLNDDVRSELLDFLTNKITYLYQQYKDLLNYLKEN